MYVEVSVNFKLILFSLEYFIWGVVVTLGLFISSVDISKDFHKVTLTLLGLCGFNVLNNG